MIGLETSFSVSMFDFLNNPFLILISSSLTSFVSTKPTSTSDIVSATFSSSSSDNISNFRLEFVFAGRFSSIARN